MLNIALKPTPIVQVQRLNELPHDKKLFIKRDDLTGFELSGNKIRKLEYAVDEALKTGATLLLTCGGHQSNHCRATAALGAQIGLPVHLFLRTTTCDSEANHFLDQLLGAIIHWQAEDAPADDLLKAMTDFAAEVQSNDVRPYIIPMGASNGIGALGYLGAFDEIVAYEKEQGFQFDAIVSAVGSGGTFAGLLLGQIKHNHPAHHIGFSVSGSTDYFNERIQTIIEEAVPYIPSMAKPIATPPFTILDQYSGPAYGKAHPEVFELIKRFAQSEGILLDPVYTGKAFYGLTQELQSGILQPYSQILFIHTGGAFALFAYKDQFNFL